MEETHKQMFCILLYMKGFLVLNKKSNFAFSKAFLSAIVLAVICMAFFAVTPAVHAASLEASITTSTSIHAVACNTTNRVGLKYSWNNGWICYAGTGTLTLPDHGAGKNDTIEVDSNSWSGYVDGTTSSGGLHSIRFCNNSKNPYPAMNTYKLQISTTQLC